MLQTIHSDVGVIQVKTVKNRAAKIIEIAVIMCGLQQRNRRLFFPFSSETNAAKGAIALVQFHLISRFNSLTNWQNPEFRVILVADCMVTYRIEFLDEMKLKPDRTRAGSGITGTLQPASPTTAEYLARPFSSQKNHHRLH